MLLPGTYMDVFVFSQINERSFEGIHRSILTVILNTPSLLESGKLKSKHHMTK